MTIGQGNRATKRDLFGTQSVNIKGHCTRVAVDHHKAQGHTSGVCSVWGCRCPDQRVGAGDRDEVVK